MFYLGSYGSRASHTEYDRLIAQWLTAGRALPANQRDLTVSELAARYWKHAKTHCRSSTGHRGELASIKLLLAHLRSLHGPKPVTEFGPLAMKGVREAMVMAGWSRTYINAQANRLRRVWKWAVQNELVAAEAWHALQAVEGLRQGKTKAPECEPIKPVDAERVDATLPFVSRPVKAMIELQSLTGMRPGEVVIMRGCDLETAGSVWVYKPAYFKTQHRGHTRSIPLGPKAQAIIGPMLKANPQAYLFCPADAETDRRQALHAIRKTPSTCGNTPGSNRTRKPKRKPGDRYDVDSYPGPLPAPATSRFRCLPISPGPRSPLSKRRDGRRLGSGAAGSAKGDGLNCKRGALRATGSPINCATRRPRVCGRNSAWRRRKSSWATDP